ncbi:MAG: 16S rRNA (cytosine(967)-C(5))-methyltransferase RsmB, partial [Pseudomonadales bacterium]|nr:16S rRNA (cytosine(967)-C(5))-methyltransferase RsmB [Pseudomonadales bacterium]
ALQQQWPGELDALLSVNNQRPPMTLRVNLGRISRESYTDSLVEAGVQFSIGELAESAIVLEQPENIWELPGFEAGLVSVQDEASQLVAPLLDLKPRQRVLDACTAPGGKLCHILESEHSLTQVVALDVNASRLERVNENLGRLQLNAIVKQANSADLDKWWDGKPFDRILLDAPCSATGVIRRHPDIKLLRSDDAIVKLQQQQLQLLAGLWPCLAEGGLLLYTTCSILNQENSEVINHFLTGHEDAKYEGVTADWGVECSYGRQLLPLEQNGPDGFFYSLLRKH